MARKVSSARACEILRSARAGNGQDFHELSSLQVDRLVEAAKHVGYRKPKTASGSRGRYFYGYLTRLCR
jgi:hypothetical protein